MSVLERSSPRTPAHTPGRTMLGVVLIGGGVAWLLDTTGGISIPWSILACVALMIVGLGLIAGAHGGRQRGLTLIGLVLVLVLLASSSVHYRIGAGIGDRAVVVRSVSELAPGYRQGIGDLKVDLRSLEWTGRQRVDAASGLGDVVILVPRGVGMRIHARMGVGELTVPGHPHRSGAGLDERFTVAGDAAGTRILDIDVSVGAGTIEVRYGR